MTAPSPAEEHAAAQAVEYGTYRAKSAIFIGGTRAFNAGDPVPVSHVEPEDRFGLLADDLVEKVDQASSAASSVPASSTPAPPAPSTTNEG